MKSCVRKDMTMLMSVGQRNRRKTTDNSTFAIGGVWYSADSFVVKRSSVLLTNIYAENPAHHKSAKHQR